MPRWEAYPHAIPDLDDAATRGCLLAMVREAHGDHNICAYPVKLNGCERWWNVGLPWEMGKGLPWESNGLFIATAATETEALVAALEAAP